MNHEEKLIAICAEVLDVDPSALSMEMKRSDIEDFDSLAVIQIIAEMQEAFGRPISDDVIEQTQLVTIGDFLKLLK